MKRSKWVFILALALECWLWVVSLGLSVYFARQHNLTDAALAAGSLLGATCGIVAVGAIIFMENPDERNQ